MAIASVKKSEFVRESREKVYRFLIDHRGHDLVTAHIHAALEWKRSFYNEHFPMSYHGCSRSIKSFDEFESLKSSSQVPIGGGYSTFRECECGQKIALLLPCRRDMSDEGKRRREFFDEWVELVVVHLQIPPPRAKDIIRSLFQERIILELDS